MGGTFFLVFWFFWVVSCIVPAIIASNKGRSVFGWIALSMVISPLLGGIIIACLTPIGAAIEQRALASGRMRKCPRCAELVKFEAQICRYCQQTFTRTGLVAALCFLLAGCASVPMSSREADQSAKRFRPTPGYAALYIVRDVTNWTAFVEAAPVWVDGHRIGGLPVKGYFALDVSPGSHRVTTESPEHFRSVTVSAGSGECAFVVISPGFGWASVRWQLETLSQSAGRDMIRKGERVSVQQ